MRFGLLNRPGYVYAVQTLADPPRVKIGRASNPAARIAGLATACPYELVTLGIWHTDVATELALHEHLAAYRVRGEWFDLGPDPLPIIRGALSSPEVAAYMERVATGRRRVITPVLDRAEALPDRLFMLVACHLLQGNGRGMYRRTAAQLAASLGRPEQKVARDLRELVALGWLAPAGQFHQLGALAQYPRVP